MCVCVCVSCIFAFTHTDINKRYRYRIYICMCRERYMWILTPTKAGKLHRWFKNRRDPLIRSVPHWKECVLSISLYMCVCVYRLVDNSWISKTLVSISAANMSRVVPWLDTAEWRTVWEWLYSRDIADQHKGVERVCKALLISHLFHICHCTRMCVCMYMCDCACGNVMCTACRVTILERARERNVDIENEKAIFTCTVSDD